MPLSEEEFAKLLDEITETVAAWRRRIGPYVQIMRDNAPPPGFRSPDKAAKVSVIAIKLGVSLDLLLSDIREYLSPRSRRQ